MTGAVPLIVRSSHLCYTGFTMNRPNLAGLPTVVAEKIAPMLDDLLGHQAAGIHSIHIVGSAVISDYNEKLSDINSVASIPRTRPRS